MGQYCSCSLWGYCQWSRGQSAPQERWRLSGDSRRPRDGFKSLRNAVTVWEQAMRLQHDLEHAFLKKGGSPETIAKIVEQPNLYLSSLLEHVRLLALNVVHINACQSDIHHLEGEAVSVKKSKRVSMAMFGLGTHGTESTVVTEKIEDEAESPMHPEALDSPRGSVTSMRNSSRGDATGRSSLSSGDRESWSVHRGSPRKKKRVVANLDASTSDLYAQRINSVRMAMAKKPKGFMSEMLAFANFSDTAQSRRRPEESVKPTWPSWLTDISFDNVIRYSRVHVRLPRKLFFTEYHMLAIRESDDEIRTATRFTDVLDVQLLAGKRFRVITSTTDHLYESPMVAHIVHQIKSRMHARKALEKFGFYYSGLGADALRGRALTDVYAVVSSISEWLGDAYSGMGNGASGSGDAYEDAATVGRDLVDFAENLYRSAMHVQSPNMPRPEPITWPVEQILLLLGRAEDAGQARLRTFLEDALGDEDAAEGFSRNKFIEHFNALPESDEGRSPDMVRQFMVGLFEYMVAKRWYEIMRILRGGKDEHEDQGRDEGGANGAPGGEINEHCDGALASFILYVTIEEAVYIPLESTLYPRTLDQRTRSNKLQAPTTLAGGPSVGPPSLRHKILRLRAQRPTQTDWEIDTKFQSGKGWRQATLILAGVEGMATPLRRLHSLVETMCCILREHEQGHEGQSDILGADDLLPIFIYVFVFAELERPDELIDPLWKLCHAEQLLGQSGYYLTLLESCVCYLQDLDE